MNVELPINIAREMYKSGNEKLFNFAKKYYLTDDLEFKLKFGDIISNNKFIVILDVINTDRQIIPIIYYNIEGHKFGYKTNKTKYSDLGSIDNYKYASSDEKHFLFSEIKKLLIKNALF